MTGVAETLRALADAITRRSPPGWASASARRAKRGRRGVLREVMEGGHPGVLAPDLDSYIRNLPVRGGVRSRGPREVKRGTRPLRALINRRGFLALMLAPLAVPLMPARGRVATGVAIYARRSVAWLPDPDLLFENLVLRQRLLVLRLVPSWVTARRPASGDCCSVHAVNVQGREACQVAIDGDDDLVASDLELGTLKSQLGNDQNQAARCVAAWPGDRLLIEHGPVGVKDAQRQLVRQLDVLPLQGEVARDVHPVWLAQAGPQHGHLRADHDEVVGAGVPFTRIDALAEQERSHEDLGRRRKGGGAHEKASLSCGRKSCSGPYTPGTAPFREATAFASHLRTGA